MKNSTKILVFIPTYRCESQIVRVLSQFDPDVQAWFDTVMVVDNHSPDGTLNAAIACGAKKLNVLNFIAWKNEDNYGLGGSHKAAFSYAIEHDFDYVVVLHGDDQADIRDLIPELEAGAHLGVDCLLGARFMAGSHLKGYSLFRTFGNRVYNMLFSSVVRRKVHDLGSGLNVYRIDAIRDFYYKKFPDDLTFNYVMLLASFHRKQKVKFFPISWREEDQTSNVRLFRQAFKVLSLLWGCFFGNRYFYENEMRLKYFERYSGEIKYRQPSSST